MDKMSTTIIAACRFDADPDYFETWGPPELSYDGSVLFLHNMRSWYGRISDSFYRMEEEKWPAVEKKRFVFFAVMATIHSGIAVHDLDVTSRPCRFDSGILGWIAVRRERGMNGPRYRKAAEDAHRIVKAYAEGTAMSWTAYESGPEGTPGLVPAVTSTSLTLLEAIVDLHGGEGAHLVNKNGITYAEYLLRAGIDLKTAPTHKLELAAEEWGDGTQPEGFVENALGKKGAAE